MWPFPACSPVVGSHHHGRAGRWWGPLMPLLRKAPFPLLASLLSVSLPPNFLLSPLLFLVSDTPLLGLGHGPFRPLLSDLPLQPGHLIYACFCHGTFAHGTLVSQLGLGSPSAGPLPGAVCVTRQCPAGPTGQAQALLPKEARPKGFPLAAAWQRGLGFEGMGERGQGESHPSCGAC